MKLRLGNLAAAPLFLMSAGAAFAQHDQPTQLAPEMLEAGAAVIANAGDADPKKVMQEVWNTISPLAWQPIDTASKDGRFILLGTWNGDEFVIGMGQWVVFDDPGRPGHWSLEDGWTTPVMVWAPIPEAPPRAE